ncbi:MAG: dihydropteroate synthase [Acidobacteria bacterium]|jgi:dihydropteroate synthase|nr:dihydropteroate synthase [Acidobacteriota bacterium]
MKFYLRDKFLELESPVVMGILNITPDSFSDGGDFFKNGAALKQAEQMIKEGAAIIDVGGESTRPGAQTVSTEQEIDRILPVIETIKKDFEVLVSVDTYKAPVARAAIMEGGADIINDISALDFDETMAETAATLDVPVILMHIKGTPENMQKNPFYSDLIKELKQYFANRIDYAFSKCIKKEKLIIDPGIGFGKRVEDNIEIIKRLKEFKEFELPILIGISRKSFLGKIAGEENPKEREIETVTAGLISILNGADIIRVHNVKNAVKSIKTLKKLVKLPLS